MLSLDAVKYNKLTIIERWRVWSTRLPPSSRSRYPFDDNGVLIGLRASILNLLSKPLVYLSCEMKLPSFIYLTWKPMKKVSSSIINTSNSFVINAPNSLQCPLFNLLSQILYHYHKLDKWRYHYGIYLRIVRCSPPQSWNPHQWGNLEYAHTKPLNFALAHIAPWDNL